MRLETRMKLTSWRLVVPAAAGILLLVMGLAIWPGTLRSSETSDRNGEKLPTLPIPVPLALKPIPPEEAIDVNTSIPLVPGGVEPPPGFHYPANPEAAVGYKTAVDCLAAAIYYEAASEP